MSAHGTITAAVLISGVLISTIFSEEALKPHPFRVPLALITILYDDNKEVIETFVTFDGSSEGWAIAAIDDRYVKDTRRERVDHFHRERINSAYRITQFEASVLEKTGKSLEETLGIFEKDLKNSKWDRLLYLDQYFPLFFRGFFYLYCGAHNSPSALPKVTKIADTLFDESMNSPKSIDRITIWSNNPEHAIKLRIAAKELAFQLKQWRMRILTIPDTDFRQDRSKSLRESYELFIRLYFNLPPAVLKKKTF